LATTAVRSSDVELLMLFSVYTKIRNCTYIKPNNAAGRTWIQVENYSYSEIHGWQEIAAVYSNSNCPVIVG
jgi:hypothetical protein